MLIQLQWPADRQVIVLSFPHECGANSSILEGGERGGGGAWKACLGILEKPEPRDWNWVHEKAASPSTALPCHGQRKLKPPFMEMLHVPCATVHGVSTLIGIGQTKSVHTLKEKTTKRYAIAL